MSHRGGDRAIREATGPSSFHRSRSRTPQPARRLPRGLNHEPDDTSDPLQALLEGAPCSRHRPGHAYMHTLCIRLRDQPGVFLVLRGNHPPKGVREGTHPARKSRVETRRRPIIALLRVLDGHLLKHARGEPHALNRMLDWLHEPPWVAWIDNQPTNSTPKGSWPVERIGMYWRPHYFPTGIEINQTTTYVARSVKPQCFGSRIGHRAE